MQVKNNIPLPSGWFFIWLFFLLKSCTCLYAQKEIDKKIDRIVTKAMAEEEFPGMAVAVIRETINDTYQRHT